MPPTTSAIETTEPVVVIVGPTAAGKSTLAMTLAEHRDAEIVSADSVQVYRGLDIGSAKPRADEQAAVPHHGIDIFDPTDASDAARWCEVADAAIASIHSRGRVPVVVGGTGLYIRALLYGLAATPPIPDDLRRSVRERAHREDPMTLHAELAELDPEAAARIAPSDRQRVGRALEVVLATGKPLSAFQSEHGFETPRYRSRLVALWPDDRSQLHERIHSRARAMLDAGWIEEVDALLRAGLDPMAPGLSTLGYREIAARLSLGDTIDRGALLETVATGHRRYAKRQLTWFRKTLARHPDGIHATTAAAALDWLMATR